MMVAEIELTEWQVTHHRSDECPHNQSVYL